MRIRNNSQHPAELIEEEAKRRGKSKDMRPLRALWPYVAAYPAMLTAALIALICATLATLALPLAVRQMIDYGFSGADAQAIDRYFIAMMGVAILLGLFSAARFYCVTWIGERVTADLRQAVYHHITLLAPPFFETTRTGEVLSRLTADTTLIKTVVGSSASIALRNAFLFAGSTIMLVATSQRLSALVALALPLIIVPMIAFGRLVRRLSRLSQDRIADTSAQAQETITAIQTVQAFTHEAEERASFARAIEESFRAARARIAARSGLTAIAFVLVFAGVVGILWVGAQYVLAGTMSGGTLGQFIIYAILCATAFAALSEVWGDIQQAAGATERLVEILAVEPEIKAPLHPAIMPHPASGDVRFDKVTFAYPSRPQAPALRDFSLHIPAGETVALVGPSGAGKSTVFQLLLRFYDPSEGVVALDGVDLKHAIPQDVRREMAIVPQETVIFAASVFDNIRFGRPEASANEIYQAAEAAQAADFIKALPQGYDTPLGERGVNLSGGQRQRIAIARALLRNAPILLLDEATSALDAESEKLIQKALGNLMAARTVLVIAHRLATVLKADRLIVLDEGRIVATGTHESLMREGGLYQRLARLQFGDDVFSDNITALEPRKA